MICVSHIYLVSCSGRGPIRELTRLKLPTPEQRAATEGIMQDMDFKQQALRLQKVWANLAAPMD